MDGSASPPTTFGLRHHTGRTGVIVLTLFQGADSQASSPLLGNTLELMAMASACGNMPTCRPTCGDDSVRIDP